MTERLPIPGSDNGTWGDILNGFLGVSLNSDGSLSSSAVATALPIPIPTTNLGSGTPSSTNYLRGDGSWAIPTGAVSSVFARTGAVVATTGDYTAAQITNAADKSSASTQSFTGSLSSGNTVTGTAVIASGMTGTTATSRYVGATANGAPTNGNFALGDFVIDQTAKIWVCTIAGTVGSGCVFTQVSASNGGVTSFNSRTGAVAPTTGDYTAAQVGALSSTSTLNSIATANTTSASVNMNSNKITNLASGVNSTDGAAYGQLSIAAGFNFITKTSAYTASSGDFVLANSSSTAFTVTSPAATTNAIVSIKKTDSSTNAITFSPASGTVDGAASFILTNQYDTYRFGCDGTNWWAF